VFTGALHQNEADAGNLNAGRTITTFTHAASNFAAGLFSAPGTPAASAGPPSAEKVRISFGR
jgi:hypothetical protein